MKSFDEFLQEQGTNQEEILESCKCPFNTDNSEDAPGAGGSTKEKAEKKKFKGKKRAMNFMKK